MLLPGDHVILNSGGPIMPVEAVEDGPEAERAVCSWQNDNTHAQHRHLFDARLVHHCRKNADGSETHSWDV